MEIAGSWITSAAERDRAGIAQHFPKTVRTLYRGCGTWTFYRFTDNDAAVSNIERQRATKYVIPAMAHLLNRTSPYGRVARVQTFHAHSR